MKKLISTLFLISPLTAMAAPGDMSFGIGYGEQSAKATSHFDKFTYKLVEARFSYGVLNNLDVEFQAGEGINTPSNRFKKNVNNLLKEKIDHYFGLYLKPKVSISQFEVYGLLGYSYTKMTGESTLDDDPSFKKVTKISTSSTSYGAGVSYQAIQNLSIYAEWKRLIDKSDGNLSGFSAGVAYNF